MVSPPTDAREADILSFSGNYSYLSNFYVGSPAPYRITLSDGEIYQLFRTSEHAYQAAKARTVEEASRVARTSNPRDAKRQGRALIVRDDWDDIKLSVMAHVIAMKFSYDIVLREKLLGTGDALLVEGNTWGDTFWGQCRGVGENHLGRTLMGVRSALLDEHTRMQLCLAHTWEIETPGLTPGPKSFGQCRNCGGVRYFNNAGPSVAWEDTPRKTKEI